MLPDSPFSLVHRICSWVVLAFLCSAIIRFMLMLDLNKRVYNHTPGPCRLIPEMENGSYAMELIKETGEIFITFGLAKSFNPNVESGIAVYQAKKENPTYTATPIPIVGDMFEKNSFAPKGISSYHSKGRTTLYVVNAHPSRSCVEVLMYQREKHRLVHRKSICDPGFHSITDIVVVGPDRFFISKMTYFGYKMLQTTELAFQTSFGSILFFDGKSITTSLNGLYSPTALAYDRTKQLLYIASLMNENVRVYSLREDMSLVFRVEVSLLSSPSGIFVDEKTGDLWISLHPVIYQAFFYSQNSNGSKLFSPSQILRVRMQEDEASWVITEPYANDGATISASTSVVFHEDVMLIGSMFGRMLHCDVLNPHIT